MCFFSILAGSDCHMAISILKSRREFRCEGDGQTLFKSGGGRGTAPPHTPSKYAAQVLHLTWTSSDVFGHFGRFRNFCDFWLFWEFTWHSWILEILFFLVFSRFCFFVFFLFSFWAVWKVWREATALWLWVSVGCKDSSGLVAHLPNHMIKMG